MEALIIINHIEEQDEFSALFSAFHGSVEVGSALNINILSYGFCISAVKSDAFNALSGEI